ncbi:hypothetical protein ACLM5J_08720 [Nocardioides sp. Bht2]|uniref:hypothetical protein n=1 Tax=Nocardioides sp. Bht2 TaxID=3392297 RepID=UPI0039B585F2
MRLPRVPDDVAEASAPVSGPARPGKRRRVLIGSALAVLVAVGGAATGLALVIGDDEKDGTRPDAQLEPTSSVLGEPSREWSVSAAELVDQPGAEFTAMVPVEGASFEPFYLEKTVLAAVSYWDEVTEESQRWTVALDSKTGKRRWVQEEEGYACALLTERRIACWESDWEANRATVTVRDTGTGKAVASAEYDAVVQEVVGDGDKVYVAGTTYDSVTEVTEIIVSSGTVDDPDGGWKTVIEHDSSDDEGGDGGIGVRVDDAGVHLAMSGGGYVLDAADGGHRTEEPQVAVRTSEGEELALAHDDSWETFWFAGHEELRFTDYPWSYGDDRPVVRGGLVGAGNTLYDLEAGRELRDVVPSDDVNVDWLSDRVLRVSEWSQYDEWGNEDYTEKVHFQDARTGTVLWRDAESRSGYASTEDAFLSTGEGSDLFEVRSLSNGKLAWRRELDLTNTVDGETYPIVADLGTTADAIVVTAGETMWGFSGFGEPDEELLAQGNVAGSGSTVEPSSEELELSDEYVTKCGSEPEFVPVTAESAEGAVEVTFDVVASCPQGQWLNSSQYRMLITGTPEGADGEQTLALGVFDFSDDPVWVPDADPGEGSRVAVRFPVSQVWATPAEIGSAISGGQILVDCDDDGASGEDSYLPVTPESTDSGSADSDETDVVVDVDTREQNSLAALQRLAAEDREPVAEKLADSWVPQLSSKQDGTHDRLDAQTYDYTGIYEEHLRLRLEYPEVRLVWSGDFAGFEQDDYWVTVAGVPSSKPGPAISWCKESGREPAHCYAKLLRVSGDHEGTTRSWKR